MSLVIEKLNNISFEVYQNKILQSLLEEYKKTYNTVININLTSKLYKYCMSYMYLLIFKSNKTDRSRLLGYFSLSRSDLNKPLNIAQYLTSHLFGNVYLFDVYIYPNYRNKGIGTYLVGKAVQTARKEYNANNVYLYTKTVRLTKFYNKNHFIFIRNVEIDNMQLLLFLRKIKKC